jgi:hypothetical protein
MSLDKLGYGTLFQDGQVFIRERGKELFSVVGVSDGSLYHDSVEFDSWLCVVLVLMTTESMLVLGMSMCRRRIYGTADCVIVPMIL